MTVAIQPLTCEPGMIERLADILIGEIPAYAYKPHGGLTATVLYYKQLAPGRRE